MPVRSLHSSVLVWPDLKQVENALRLWAEKQARGRPQLQGVGYFGSYARGDWGVGSDLDVVIVLSASDRPAEKRLLDWDSRELPVPVDLFAYTLAEWKTRIARQDRFAGTLQKELRWLYRREGFDGIERTVDGTGRI